MKIIKFVGIVFITFLTTRDGGPDVPYITVPITYGAQSRLYPDSTTVLLINQFDPAQLKISNQKKLEVIKAGAYTSVKYAETQFKQLLPNIKIINLVDSVGFKASPDSVKLLAVKYQANYVLALKDFKADVVLSDVQSSNTYLNTNISVNFKLYEGNGLYYKNLNGAASDLQPEGSYIFGSYGALFVPPAIYIHPSYINTTAQHATQDALQEYLPYTISHDRPLYTDNYLMRGVNEIYAGNFGKAINLLGSHLQDKNVKKVSKTAYNMAVTYEAMGNIDSAILMAKLSVTKLNNEYATSILEDLRTE